MAVEWIAAYLALGAVVGFMAGLLGIGGGGIMVPVLTALFAAQGVENTHLVHLALGTSMAAIVVTAISSLRTHHQHQAVLWPVVMRITPAILIGTFAATWLATLLPTRALAIFFLLYGLRFAANGAEYQAKAAAPVARYSRRFAGGIGDWQHFGAGGYRRRVAHRAIPDVV